MSQAASTSNATLIGGAIAAAAASFAVTSVVRDYIFRLQAQADIWSDVVEQSAPIEDEGDEDEWYKSAAMVSTPTVKTVSLPVESSAPASRQSHARSDSITSTSTAESSVGARTPSESETEYFEEHKDDLNDGVFIAALPRTREAHPRVVLV
ncbi:hypothetical protein CBOM_06955 [Ceraceosorus bombacis]|uniref:Uncharacterized protein n=1 Tax=Ceraceosorus bombacis TaxID=401625 RepID=A0A0P1BM12_9BASI|nr:hypothetical protein CBOM_06955 [Ceraceosorus bombacis]